MSMRRTLCMPKMVPFQGFAGLKSDTAVRLSASQTILLTDHHDGVVCSPHETIRLSS